MVCKHKRSSDCHVASDICHLIFCLQSGTTDVYTQNNYDSWHTLDVLFFVFALCVLRTLFIRQRFLIIKTKKNRLKWYLIFACAMNEGFSIFLVCLLLKSIQFPLLILILPKADQNTPKKNHLKQIETTVRYIAKRTSSNLSMDFWVNFKLWQNKIYNSDSM